MPLLTPEAADALSRLSAFALFVFLVALITVGLWKRKWVPGWLYLEEHDARLVSETQAEQLASALEANNAAMAALVKELAIVRRELKGLRDDLRKLGGTRDRA